jgi:hypothetical protein
VQYISAHTNGFLAPSICILTDLMIYQLPPIQNKVSAHAHEIAESPRSRVCARLTLSSAPHQQQRKFFGAYVFGVGDSKHFLIFHKKPKKFNPQGAEGSLKCVSLT